MPIDYSKWKSIEVSDDEDDTHPNIDTPSLFRWRHQARLERMAEMKQKKEEVEGQMEKGNERVKEIDDKLAGTSLDDKEKVKLELEKADILKQEEEFRAKEKELEEQEAKAPWNVDTIGHEAWSKTHVNKYSEKKPEPKKPIDDEAENKRMMDFFRDNESKLRTLAVLPDFQLVENFLIEYPYLASEFTTSWLTIEALNLSIDEEFVEMGKYAQNCITIQYLLELAKSLNALPTNTNVIKTFFKKIRAADQLYMKMYDDEVESFKDRLIKRGRDKREAALAEVEAEEKEERIKLAPGGLDPKEVFDSLPEAMQKAFEAQDIPALIKLAETMDGEVFKHHLDRCIASGLWVPGPSEDGEASEEKQESPEKKEAA